MMSLLHSIQHSLCSQVPVQYTHRLYITPPGSSCTWAGLAFVGCDQTVGCRAWARGDVYTSQQLYMHELGHNLFLGHSGTSE